MSKKACKKSNPNRPGSKNNPDGDRNDSPIDWAEYDKGRRAEGRLCTERMREVADKVRRIVGKPPSRLDWEVSAYWRPELKRSGA